MAGFVEGPCRTFVASAAISQFARVKYDGTTDTISTAGLTDKGIGTAENQAWAAGDEIAVRLWGAQGTRKMIAGAAIARGAAVNTLASGKIDDNAASTSFVLGYALEAATADGDIIEVLTHGLDGAAL